MVSGSGTKEAQVELSLKWGSGYATCAIPKQNSDLIIEAPVLTPIAGIQTALEAVIENPAGTAPLRELIQPQDRVAIVTSDITRLASRPDVTVPFLLRKLVSWGVPESNITVIIATGTHRGQTPEERVRIVGEEAIKRFAVVDHDCHDAGAHTFLGTTSRGTPVHVNRAVAHADKTILTGGIEFHPFAGFGGGRKAICPGVSSYLTITTNHSLSLGTGDHLFAQNVEPGKLEGNPVSEDMAEIAAMVNPTFLLNSIVDQDARIVELVGGDWRLAFRKGCERVRQLHAVEIDHRSDVVVVGCGGYPRDVSYYQSAKGIFAALAAVKDGGAIVLVSECRDGFGQQEVERWIEFPNLVSMRAALAKEFSLGGYMAFRLLATAVRHPTYVVSTISDELARKLGVTKVASIDEALSQIRARNGDGIKISVIPSGKQVQPVVAGE